MKAIKISKWYKTSEGLVYIMGQNEADNDGNKPMKYLTEWIIDKEFITTDGVYRPLPEEGVKEVTDREIWSAIKEVHEELIQYKKKFLEVAHYVSTVQHALDFSSVKNKEQQNASIH